MTDEYQEELKALKKRITNVVWTEPVQYAHEVAAREALVDLAIDVVHETGDPKTFESLLCQTVWDWCMSLYGTGRGVRPT